MKKKKTPEGVTETEFEKWNLEVIGYINTLPRCDLVRICAALNRYEWLDELQGKPAKWDDMDINERSLWIRNIFRYIKTRIGDKAMLRYCHKVEYGVTDQEFDDWWDSNLLRTLEEEQNELHKSYCSSQSSNNERNYGSFFIKSVLPFALCLIAAFFLGIFVGYSTIAG